MGCHCPNLSHKTYKKCGEGAQGKKRLKMPTQNRSARGKTMTEKSDKSKATESSQGRAQIWWRPSRAEKPGWSAGGKEK